MAIFLTHAGRRTIARLASDRLGSVNFSEERKIPDEKFRELDMVHMYCCLSLLCVRLADFRQIFKFSLQIATGDRSAFKQVPPLQIRPATDSHRRIKKDPYVKAI